MKGDNHSTKSNRTSTSADQSQSANPNARSAHHNMKKQSSKSNAASKAAYRNRTKPSANPNATSTSNQNSSKKFSDGNRKKRSYKHYKSNSRKDKKVETPDVTFLAALQAQRDAEAARNASKTDSPSGSSFKNKKSSKIPKLPGFIYDASTNRHYPIRQNQNGHFRNVLKTSKTTSQNVTKTHKPSNMKHVSTTGKSDAEFKQKQHAKPYLNGESESILYYLLKRDIGNGSTTQVQHKLRQTRLFYSDVQLKAKLLYEFMNGSDVNNIMIHPVHRDVISIVQNGILTLKQIQSQPTVHYVELGNISLPFEENYRLEQLHWLATDKRLQFVCVCSAINRPEYSIWVGILPRTRCTISNPVRWYSLTRSSTWIPDVKIISNVSVLVVIRKKVYVWNIINDSFKYLFQTPSLIRCIELLSVPQICNDTVQNQNLKVVTLFVGLENGLGCVYNSKNNSLLTIFGFTSNRRTMESLTPTEKPSTLVTLRHYNNASLNISYVGSPRLLVDHQIFDLSMRTLYDAPVSYGPSPSGESVQRDNLFHSVSHNNGLMKEFLDNMDPANYALYIDYGQQIIMGQHPKYDDIILWKFQRGDKPIGFWHTSRDQYDNLSLQHGRISAVQEVETYLVGSLSPANSQHSYILLLERVYSGCCYLWIVPYYL